MQQSRFVIIALGALASLAACGGTANLGDGWGGRAGADSGATAGSGTGGHTSGGARPSVGATPYPLNPTVPIDAECACADQAQVCNAAGQCVARCDAQATACAAWRVERAVVAMFANGDDLYLQLGPERDLFGNPLPGEAGTTSLWKARYPDLPPQRLGTLPTGAFMAEMLGHAGGKTFFRGEGSNSTIVITAIGDDGTTSEWRIQGGYAGARVRNDGVYLRLEDTIVRAPLTLDGTFEPVIDSRARVHVVFIAADRLWFNRGDSWEICNVDPNQREDVVCASVPDFRYSLFGVTGNDFFEFDHVLSNLARRTLGGATKILYRADGKDRVLNQEPSRFGNWMYAFGRNGSDVIELLRFPADHAALPEAVFDREVARALTSEQADPLSPVLPHVTVSESSVFWVQRFDDLSTEDANLSRYVFRAPRKTQ